MQKRAQSEIIITVLIVLVALAAVGIIAAFIISQVRDSVQTAEVRAKVSSIELVVTDAKAGNNFIILQRTSNNPDITIANISIVINGNLINSSVDLSAGWNVLESKQANLTVNLGSYILQRGDNLEIYVTPAKVSKVISVLVTKADVTQISTNPASSSGNINLGSISTCGTITSSGTYILQNDLTASGTCFNILGKDIIFDFNGHILMSSNLFSNVGVYIKDSSNFTLRNTTVLLFDKGLIIENSKSVVLDSVKLMNNSLGLFALNSNMIQAYNLSVINNSQKGVYLSNASNFQVITPSSVLGNGNASGHGIYLTNYSGLCGPVVSMGNHAEDLLCDGGSIFKSGGSSVSSLVVSAGCSWSFGTC